MANDYFTYDISDLDMETIVRVLEERGMHAVASRVNNPLCRIDERLVYTASAFREHMDGCDDDDQAIIDSVNDSDIEAVLGDEFIYNAWVETCSLAMDELRVKFNTEDDTDKYTDR